MLCEEVHGRYVFIDTVGESTKTSVGRDCAWFPSRDGRQAASRSRVVDESRTRGCWSWSVVYGESPGVLSAIAHP